MKTIAIIGGAFGDEGKGLMTNYMCDQMLKDGHRPAVVRFQGGAQSGHTVVTPEGHRHVFSHFGSGTLSGVPTILSSKFVCNPFLFLVEYQELKGYGPAVYIDQDCYITTPFDVSFNQELERSRGKDRHGSVGVGFGETIQREEVGKISFRYKDLYSMGDNIIKSKLHSIRHYYLERCLEMNVDHRKVLYGKKAVDLIFEDLVKFKQLTTPFMIVPIKVDSLIFEGGQGLGLDMEYGEFPHVTRSKTGIYHAQEFCDQNNIKLEEVIYLTRSYTTRHGAGELRNESNEDFTHIVDKTNKTNEFQESLRFAPLDSDMFTDLTGKDTDNFNGSVKYMITCLDQIKEKNKIFIAGDLIDATKEDFIGYAKGTFDYWSFGPTRKDVIINPDIRR